MSGNGAMKAGYSGGRVMGLYHAASHGEAFAADQAFRQATAQDVPSNWR